MKEKLHGPELDNLTFKLLRNYSDQIREDQSPLPAYFMTRLRARIAQEQQTSQVWEFGVISAKNWLFALSLVALMFFFGNLMVLNTQFNLFSSSSGNQSLNGTDERDFVHTDEDVEALNVDEFQKE